MWLFLLLLIVPIIEIALFIEVGGWLGLWPTLAIVILTAVTGTFLLRSQGAATLHDLQSSLSTGRNPLTLIAHGALILAAALLLMTPGFFTDAVGFSFLIPPVRSALIAFASKRMTVQSHVHMQGRPQPDARPRGSETIDGEFSVVTGSDIDEDDATFGRDAHRRKGASRWTKPPE